MEILIVVAIMALISGGVSLVAIPMYNKAKVDTAHVGCREVQKAAELYQSLDGVSDACPTIQDLVQSRKLQASTTNDPWGSSYKIVCGEADIHVVSFGKDKKEGTEDDIRDDMNSAAIKKIKDKL